MSDSPAIQLIDPTNMNPRLNPELVVDGAGLLKVKDYFERIAHIGRPEFVIDTEFNIVDDMHWHERRLRTIQVGDREEQYIIDLLAFAGSKEALIGGQGNRPLEPSRWAKPIVDVLRPVLDTNAFLKIGHQLQTEYEMLSYCLGIYMWNLFDTLLAEKSIYAGAIPFHQKDFWGLDDLVKRYMRLQISKEEQTTFDLETPLTERQLIYTALDCRLPFGIKTGQIQTLRKDRLAWSNKIDCDAIPPFGDAHVTGFMLDKAAWRQIIVDKIAENAENVSKLDVQFLPLVGRKPILPSEEEINAAEEKFSALAGDSPEMREIKERLTQSKDKADKVALRAEHARLKEARQQLYKEARKEYAALNRTQGKTFQSDFSKMQGEAAINYGSTKQLLKALRRMPGLEEIKGTDDGTLKKLIGHPAIDALRAYRKTDKFIDAFGEKMFSHINEFTDRIHCYINLYGAETGRTTASKPNLQQIPKDKKFRAAFRARPGYKILTLDYSGCELRILADYSNDAVWIDAFNHDKDVHCIVAQMMKPVQWAEATLEGCLFATSQEKCKCPEHNKIRDKGKPVSFGIPYGATEYSLSDSMNIPKEEAKELLGLWHKANPNISKFLKAVGEQARDSGEARTKADRRRILPRPSFAMARQRLIEDWRERGRDGYPKDKQVNSKFQIMLSGLERQGRNTPIQGTNAEMMKLALGCGIDEDGKPFQWHYLRPDKGNGFLVNMVHDEQVVEAPEDRAQPTKEVCGECMMRAGAVFIKSVPMTYDYHIEDVWTK